MTTENSTLEANLQYISFTTAFPQRAVQLANWVDIWLEDESQLDVDDNVELRDELFEWILRTTPELMDSNEPYRMMMDIISNRPN